MVKRLTSLVMLIIVVNVYIRSQLSPNDPLFLFFSNDMPLNISMILLASLVAMVTFSNRFRHWLAYAACVALAVFLCIVGSLGLLSTGISYWLSGFLLPMDSMLVLESGIILALCALTYEHAGRPASMLPDVPSYLKRFALLIPRLPDSTQPHPPSPARTA